MIKKTFETKLQADIYLVEQKMRMEKGYLTVSERKELKNLLEKPEQLVVKQPEEYKGKKIITNIDALRVPCLEIRPDEGVTHIIKDLKEAHVHYGGLGISANQIGYNRKISYIKIFKRFDPKTKEFEYSEYIMINPQIIEKDKPTKVIGEGCLSFPGVFVDTKRYVYCTCQYEDENRKPQVISVQDLESFAIQHEYDHSVLSLTIFDRKWKAK